MNCTFYRPTTINTKEFENIIGKLSYDLHQLETEQHDEWSVYTYFYALSCHALPLEKNPAMSFIGLAAPDTVELCWELNKCGFQLPLEQLNAEECAQTLYEVLKV